jgi:tricarballylate dehydrogenase
MTGNVARLVVVGHGAAALSAAEQARQRQLPLDITLLEKSGEADAGGNTRWSPSYMRMAAPDRLGSGFEEDMQQASGGLADQDYVRTLAKHAVGTIGWLQGHGVEFVTPVYYLSAGPARIQPVGGGRTIVERLAVAAKQAGVNLAYQSAAERLVTKQGRIRGVEIGSGAGDATTVDADAVVLASVDSRAILR